MWIIIDDCDIEVIILNDYEQALDFALKIGLDEENVCEY